MKKYIAPSLIMLVGLSLVVYGITNNKKPVEPTRDSVNDKVIVKQITDDRGLTSVQFYYSFWPTDTMAFDYLSPAEYNRQFNDDKAFWSWLLPNT